MEMSVQKVGSARAMVHQRPHEPMSVSSVSERSLKRTRDVWSRLSGGSRVAWRRMSQMISTGVESVLAISTVLVDLRRRVLTCHGKGIEMRRFVEREVTGVFD